MNAAASDTLESIRRLAALHEKNLSILPPSKRGTDTVRMLFDHIEQHPIIDIKRTAVELGLSYNTVSSAVRKLIGCGILYETGNAARNRVFAYTEYLDILRRDT